MNWLEKEFKRTGSALREAVGPITPKGIPIKLSDETLNKAAGTYCESGGVINTLRIAMHDGWFQTDAHIVHDVAEFDAKVAFEIVHFKVSKQSQVIELRRKGAIETDAKGWVNKIALATVSTFISAITGEKLLGLGVLDRDGITFYDDKILVDLGKIGAKDALYGALREKVGSAAPYLSPLLQGGVDKLVDLVAINSANCSEGALVVNVEYAGG
jgi:hypothetical protein